MFSGMRILEKRRKTVKTWMEENRVTSLEEARELFAKEGWLFETDVEQQVTALLKKPEEAQSIVIDTNDSIDEAKEEKEPEIVEPAPAKKKKAAPSSKD